MCAEYDRSTSVGVLRGVGAAREAALAKLGVRTLGDLIEFFPRAYQNRGCTVTISEAAEMLEAADVPRAIIMTVASEPSVRMIKNRMTILKFRAFDSTSTASCSITYFNQPFLRDVFHTGASFRFYGKVTREGKGIAMSSPIWEPYVEGVCLPSIVPVYPLTGKLTEKYIRGLTQEAITRLAPTIEEYLPEQLLHDEGLCSYRYAIENIHFPANAAALDQAYRRLVFDELFFFSLRLAGAGRRNVREKGCVMEHRDTDRLYAKLPFSPTNAQKRAIAEISDDMASGYQMKRILTGDVGSGKTLCAAAAAYIAAENGYLTALMAPTDILARQHFQSLAPLLSSLGYRVELLTGSLGVGEKRAIRQSLAMGEIDLIIGTHALITADVEMKGLGLVITDEQHRFGVRQREELAAKGSFPHLLLMSATPIPRTLSLVMYGSLDVSRLDELPPGRQKVSTFVVNEAYRARLDGFILKQAESGFGTYIVCPAIEETKEASAADEVSDLSLIEAEQFDTPPLKTAVEYAKALAERLPQLKIGVMHGRMKPSEKDSVMEAFADGELQVLVSTTVIEVGVNVPRATLMIVENAERFGLSQLHQLRGRVGRGSEKSYCILVSDSKSEIARRRLELLRTTHDGYKIAEGDLSERGPGDFFSYGGEIRQSGAIKLRLAAGCKDSELIESSVCAARSLYESDPTLSLPQHAMIKQRLEEQNSDS